MTLTLEREMGKGKVCTPTIIARWGSTASGTVMLPCATSPCVPFVAWR